MMDERPDAAELLKRIKEDIALLRVLLARSGRGRVSPDFADFNGARPREANLLYN
jgi:hypothetical protein